MARPIMSQTTFGQTLQQVKGALYDKDYERAFGTDRYRLAYCARWVPSRALIYRRIFAENSRAISTAIKGKGKLCQDDEADAGQQGTRVVMVGGGAGSEVVAIASWFAQQLVHGAEDMTTALNVTPVDTADWAHVLTAQQEAINRTHPQLENRFAVNFVRDDILDPTTQSLDWQSTSLVTILFTISELFLQSRPKTFSLLSTISTRVGPGTLLLIVESVALASIPVGSSGRSYPVGMLLDGALTLDKGKHDNERAQWECLCSEDAKWYRLPSDAQDAYPGQQLENTRVVIRLYRRL
ncbi:hypothetical protein OIV83_003294 [Microbotryomycetes sp. JL201]|nr:hypothetical protein OIV83_003294 [Microbotryomycetes sp. JL201]